MNIFDKKNPEIKEYLKNTKEIKNYLITIKTLLRKKEDTKTTCSWYVGAGCVDF